MKKCSACGKLVNEHLEECPACGGRFPSYRPTAPQPSGASPRSASPRPAGPGPGMRPAGFPSDPGMHPGVAPPVTAAGVPPPPEPYSGYVQMGDYAGFWIRFGAYFIDSLPFAMYSIALQVLGGRPNQPPSPLFIPVFILGTLVVLTIWIGNNVILQGLRGWTVGKRICRIIVLSKDGELLGIGRTLLREMFKGTISSCFCDLGFIWQAFDSQGQAWHDKIAGSFVYYD